MAGFQLIGQMRRSLAYHGELLYDRTSDKFRRLEARTIESCYELRKYPDASTMLRRYNSSRRIDAPGVAGQGIANEGLETVLGHKVHLAAK